MPTPTYDLIASNVLGTSAASITFSSISSSYRDLVLVARMFGSTPDVAREMRLRVNSDTGSNYSSVSMNGDGSSATSATSTISYGQLGTADTTKPILSILQFLDYSATDKHKPILLRANRPEVITGYTTTGADAKAIRWANTAAIDTILLYPSSGNIEAGSSFYLYGIVS